MGNIANKRGGAGGRNAPPQVYMGFGDFGNERDANPIGAVLDVIKFFVVLVFLGLVIWIYQLLTNTKG